MGISRDSMASHQKFSSKLELPYPLLSDAEGEVCRAYGVLKNKLLFGKEVTGIERSTFLIGKDGELLAIWRKVKAVGHAEQVLEHVRNSKQEL